MDYKIVRAEGSYGCGNHDSRLEQQVKFLLAEGWELQGGIAFDSYSQRCIQAMVKKSSPPPNLPQKNNRENL